MILSENLGQLSQVISERMGTEDLENKFEALFPTWPTMLATILSLLIAMCVLGPLVYKAVKKMVEKRRKYIQDNIDHAETLHNEALVDREKASQEIIRARLAASEIISSAKLEAEGIKTNGITSAKDEASKIIALAKSDIKREKEVFAIESKKEIIDVAMAAAKHVINKEVDKELSEKMINDFINTK